MTTPVTFQKIITRSDSDEVEKAALHLETLIAKHQAEHNVGRPAATVAVVGTEAGRAAYNAHEISKKNAYREAPIGNITKAAIEKAQSEIDAIDEEARAFGIMHNLPPSEARKRLGIVDSTFEKRFRAAYNAKGDADHAAHLEREEHGTAQTWKRGAAERDAEVQKRAAEEDAINARRTPHELALTGMIEGVALAKGIDRSAASAEVMKTDRGRRLYGKAESEKKLRAHGAA